MSQQDLPKENGAPPNQTTNTSNVRMSECIQTGNDGGNPFTTSGSLENGQFDVGNGNGGNNRFGFSSFHNYNVSRKHLIVTKVKEATNRHCNEYRIAVFILVILIIIGFSVLVRMNKNILTYQDHESFEGASSVTRKLGKFRTVCNGEENCCSEENKCGEMEGDCNSDKECLSGLKCGQNNCNENSGNWDSTDDCCYKPKNIELTSSSVFGNETKRWGPDFVIDGVISHNVKSFFHSELEDYPWLQWHLPRQVKMLGITLTTRFDCCGDRLRDVEIRAGKSSTENGFKGQIKVNELCGEFLGPGETGKEHTITCDHAITADYITIQILDDRAILALNEIRLETVSHDKSTGCKGGDSCCTSSIPCGEWEGDCDSDDECQPGLVCGHNNCPLKPQGFWSHGDWDTTDDCCYRARNETGTAISSSTKNDDDDTWGPKNAIDGLWSDTDGLLFQSKEENMPWMQWHLPNTTSISGIMISSRNKHSEGRLKHLEVRAGTSFVEPDFTGKMKLNDLCGTFDGPGKDRRVYTIMCEKEIKADYITLQILDLNSILQVNELEIITKSQASSLGCDCHEYINQNGYGQCKKKDFNQEHVKDLHVCYVNQPSNCPDLYASVTDPGKKLSAHACPIGDARESTTEGNTDSYKCYHYTVDEDEMIDSEAKNKEVCENHSGFIFTKGDVTKAPGCSDGCWCCQPI